ncbi:cation:proton antiporter domain-containing protein [Streptomyces alboflavus]|uniref:cation:proton antiporter domain-containing protein n=1 Tax=Streptomyces TaxID=1883 RepID=UPI003AAE4919
MVPTDFAPAETLVRDTRIAARVRDVLNVESGYNDGIISPVFLFALILAGSTSQAHTPMQALGTAVPFAAKALAVGVALGSLLAWLMITADRRQWMTGQSRRVLVLVTPLLVYTVTVAAGGNGFVAAFVCGIAFRCIRQTPARRHETHAADLSAPGQPGEGPLSTWAGRVTPRLPGGGRRRWCTPPAHRGPPWSRRRWRGSPPP